MPRGTRDERSYSIRRFDETPVAIRTMGTNALPYLLKWTQYEPGQWKRKILPVLNGWLARLNPKWQLPEDSPAYYREYAAKCAIFMLLDDPNGEASGTLQISLGKTRE
jgi:hypothetical protein